MRRALFQPTAEGEARLLLLIAAFSVNGASLEGRTKLAKLDFLLRYPLFFARALAMRPGLTNRARTAIEQADSEGPTIESRMMRYRYGPWDPAYFALLGRLVGKGLVETVSEGAGVGYRVTERGVAIAGSLADTEAWASTAERAALLKAHFDLTGNGLKNFIYDNFPEVAGASWGQTL
ncbi:MAG TPA: hypothetical protein VF006_13020 [Longimicrobium sp.]